MQFKRLNDDDYCMGLAFMASIRSNDAKIGLFCDANNIIHLCQDNQPSHILSENEAYKLSPDHYLFAMCNFKSHGILYLTYNPDFSTVLFLTTTLVKKIVYYATENVNIEIENLCQNANITLQKYDGNLFWLKDYIHMMQESDIF